MVMYKFFIYIVKKSVDKYLFIVRYIFGFRYRYFLVVSENYFIDVLLDFCIFGLI